MKDNAPSDYIPRKLHDQHVLVLTDRCVAAEQAVLDLLNTIDPEILERHGHDWLAAVRELLK
jgi:UDP-N-acetylenolpyruvoylglucosamine reductase